MPVSACQLFNTIFDVVVVVVERKWGWGGLAEKFHVEVELCDTTMMWWCEQGVGKIVTRSQCLPERVVCDISVGGVVMVMVGLRGWEARVNHAQTKYFQFLDDLFNFRM